MFPVNNLKKEQLLLIRTQMNPTATKNYNIFIQKNKNVKNMMFLIIDNFRSHDHMVF